MLGRTASFAAGILLWGVGRGFGLPAGWVERVAHPAVAVALLAVASSVVAIVLVVVPWRGRRRVPPLLWWGLAGVLWASVWGASGTGDAWRYHGADEARWEVRWSEVAPAGSTRPWTGTVVRRNGVRLHGRVQVWPAGDCAADRWLPGDSIAVQARLNWPDGARNPGQVDARAGLATGGFSGRLQVAPHAWCAAEPLAGRRWLPAAWAERGRRAVWQRLEAGLGDDWAGFAAGLLLGRSDQAPAAWREAFRVSGALHLMAVSGTHLSLVVAPLWPLLRRWRWFWWLPLGVGLAYVWISGASPSAMRAGMQLLLTLALRRQLHGSRLTMLPSARERLEPWATAGLLVLTWEPLALFRPALQLSLAASAGICLWADRWRALLEGRLGGSIVAAYAADGLAAGLAAQTAVLPLSLVLFGGLAPAGFVSSFVLLPVTALALHALLAGLLLALALPSLGVLALAPAAMLLRALAGLALAVAKLPVGWLWWPGGAVGAMAVAGLYGAASGLWRWPGRKVVGTAVICGVCLHVALPLILPATVTGVGAPSVTVRLTFLDVGQGDAIVIEAPDGTVTLVDGGGSPDWQDSGYDPGQAVIVPYLRWRRIGVVDRMIISHAHADHVGGLAAVLREVPVRELIEPGDPSRLGDEQPGAAYAAVRRLASELGVPQRYVRAGDGLDLGGGLSATVLGPPDPPWRGTRSDLNSNSIVLQLAYGRWRALLTGDLEAVAEDALIAGGANLDVHLLKVAHHGSNYSTQPHWLEATSPALAVISAGGRNPFGHPGADTLHRLADARACTMRTDQSGAVTVMTDGRRWRARTFSGGSACAEVPAVLPPRPP